MALTFYTNPNSRGRIVRWMLEELGCDYDTVVLDYEQSSETDKWGGAALARPSDPADRRRRFFDEVNPMGKIPAIEHDGRVVTESGAIVAYLAETFPAAGLAPTAQERADYYRWMFFAAGPLEASVTLKALGFEIPQERLRMAGCGSFGDVMGTLEKAVSAASPYIAGKRFTAADVYVGSHIGWGLAFGSIEKRQAFVDYFGRLSERDAYKRATALDEEAAKAMQAA